MAIRLPAPFSCGSGRNPTPLPAEDRCCHAAGQGSYHAHQLYSLNMKQGEIFPHKGINLQRAVWVLYLLVRKCFRLKAFLCRLFMRLPSLPILYIWTLPWDDLLKVQLLKRYACLICYGCRPITSKYTILICIPIYNMHVPIYLFGSLSFSQIIFLTDYIK